ncbi:MAG TPA: OmpH family outer membrane protein [Chitinophagales bacterium]|jgi:outer membrane protein|nr:OmpH family outer membrane protein [Chitinophagales bacterium]HQG39027.1 OmpH family outer membrane protein [Chitinophagales bacterium]
MKNLSLALNAVLFVLVGVLFYLHFNSKPGGLAAPQVINTNGKSVTVPQIAYIDIDSFQTNYAYFKTGKLALEARQKTMEAELGRSLSAFQTEYNSFVQKAQTMTEEEGMAAQQKLQEKQQKIEERKQMMEAQFMKETHDFNLLLQEKIVEYLKKYNANGAYTYIFPYSRETINILFVNPANDITSVVLKGMNDEYAANKK